MRRPHPVVRPPAALGETALLAAIPDLARAGALEPLADALDGIVGLARDINRRREPGWRARLERLQESCEILAQSLSGRQRRIMQEIAETQGRIQQRRRYTGTSLDAPAVDWRG
jgi:hypothetical protein